MIYNRVSRQLSLLLMTLKFIEAFLSQGRKNRHDILDKILGSQNAPKVQSALKISVLTEFKL